MSQNFTDDVFAGTHNGQTDLQNMEYNFAALKSQFSGTSAPSNPVAGMVWVDTTNEILKIRNLANTAWVNIYDFANVIFFGGVDSGLIVAGMLASAAVTESNMASASVNRAALKTSTGVSSGTGTGTGVQIVMQDYCFFPSVRQVSQVGMFSWNGSDPGDTVGRFVIDTISSQAYTIRWRYVTATDRPFVYAIRNANGEIEHIWACEDPPPPYWHMGSKPADFKAPLQVMNKRWCPAWLERFFGRKTEKPEDEVVIFDYDLNEYRALIDRADMDKKLLHEMLTKEYELPTESKIFRRKNLAEI